MPSSNALASSRGFSVMGDPVRSEIAARRIEADVERAAADRVGHGLLDDHGLDPLDAAGQAACADLRRVGLVAELAQRGFGEAHLDRLRGIESVDARDLAE